MVQRDEVAEAAAKKSWQVRRRIKRLFLGWFILSLFFAEAGASWFGIFIASLNAIGALLSIPAYPFWSLAIFAIDVLIIYGLAAYGGDRRITAG